MKIHITVVKFVPECLYQGVMGTIIFFMLVAQSEASGLIYNSVNDTCESSPNCGAGIYNPQINLCAASQECLFGSAYSSSNNRCESPAYCESGATNASGICEMPPACGKGVYDPQINLCAAPPICDPPGSYNPTSKKCEAGATTSSTTCTTQYNCYNVTDKNNCGSAGMGDYYTFQSSCSLVVGPRYDGCVSNSNGYTTYNCSSNTYGCYYSSGGGWMCYANVPASYITQCDPYQSCSTTYSCPSGYTLSGTTCYAPAACNSGSLNTTTDKCVMEPTCLTNFTLNGNICTSSPKCADGLTLSGNICITSPTCQSGLTLNSSLNQCTAPASCTYGNLDTNDDVCVSDGSLCRGEVIPGTAPAANLKDCKKISSDDVGTLTCAELDLDIDDPTKAQCKKYYIFYHYCPLIN